MSYTAIIFDFGDVLFTDDHVFMKEKEVLGYCGVEYEQLVDAWKAFYIEYYIGQMSEDEFWHNLFTKLNSKDVDADVEKMKYFYRKFLYPIEGMRDFALKLKNKYKLFALTDVGKEWQDYKTETYKLDELFDVIVTSACAGYKKPNIELYKILLDKIKIPAKECIFIDDREKSLKPAQELGITTILFTNRQELESKLKGLGIEF